MCAYFSRRHHLAGRGDAGQDAAAATALLGDYRAQVTGSDFRQGRHRLEAQGGLYGAYFRLSQLGQETCGPHGRAHEFRHYTVGNLGNSLTTKARLQEEVRLVEFAQSTRVRYTDMGVTNEVPFSSRCTTISTANRSPTGSLPPAVPLAITPTSRPWTHTSEDSYFYQLSLVLATATVSLHIYCNAAPVNDNVVLITL